MNFVKVENGVVVQSDRTGKPPKGFVQAASEVVPGFLYDGSAFTAPATPPRSVEVSPMKKLRADFDGLVALLTEKGVI